MIWLDGVFPRYDRGPSIEDFRQEFITRMDQALVDPENRFRKKIENAHWTVKTTSARVTGCSVYTVDGSDRAGKDCANISEIDCVVTAFWDGVIQKGGYTEIRMSIDGRTGQLKSCAYVGGNALFNAEEIDWGKVMGDVVLPIAVACFTGGG